MTVGFVSYGGVAAATGNAVRESASKVMLDELLRDEPLAPAGVQHQLVPRVRSVGRVTVSDSHSGTGGVQQEVADVLGLVLQHLVDQVVQDEVVAEGAAQRSEHN